MACCGTGEWQLGRMREKGSHNWSAEEDRIVRQNAGMMGYEQLAELLPGRSAEAVQLYMYRHHLPVRRQLRKAIVPEMLRLKFGDATMFAPNKAFYGRIKVSTQRWNKLRFGYDQPTQEEIVRIARALNMQPDEMLKLQDAMQLELEFDIGP